MYKLYDPTIGFFFEIGNVKFNDDNGSTEVRDIVFKKQDVNILTTITIIVTDSDDIVIPHTI